MTSMANNQSTQFELPEIIMEGERNNTIFKYGINLKRNSKSKDEIAALLKKANAERCMPPMSDNEVSQITRSVLSMRSGKPMGTGRKQKEQPVKVEDNLSAPEQAAQQLESLFASDDLIVFVTKFTKKDDGKWAPTGKPETKPACSVIRDLHNASSLDEVFPDYNKEAGILFHVNPMKYNGRKSKDVAVFRNALVEYDDITKDEQISRMLSSGLPIQSMTDSGNKSVHTIVRIDAKDAAEYSKRVSMLYGCLEKKYGSACDQANKNPSRLTRLAGAERKGNTQSLLYTEINASASIDSFLDSVKKSTQEKQVNLRHDEIADILINDYSVCFVEGIPAIKIDGRYVLGQDSIFRTIIGVQKNASTYTRNEVMRYLTLMAPHKKQADERYIRFKNGILDIDTLKLIADNGELMLLNEIPHNWNPDASSELVDTVFSRIAQQDKAVIANIWEMFGLSMYRGHDISRLILLQGSGANGKSTLLDMLKYMLGNNNYFSLPIHKLGEKFQLVPSMGKLALIGDDIAKDRVNDTTCAIMKKFVTGETVSDQYKGGASFQFEPYATLIYSCNEIPRFSDGSFGVERRLHPIPLSARFQPGDEGFDPRLKQKLCHEDCIEYAIIRAIEALCECRSRMELTPNKLCDTTRSDIMKESDCVRAFIEHYQASGKSSFIGATNSDIYSSFVKWCSDSNETPISMATFSKRLCSYENLRSVSSNGKRRYESK